MRILDRSVYVGPSLYAHFPVIRLELDLGELENWPSAKLGEAFVSGLLEALPGLLEHGCSYREPGGFVLLPKRWVVERSFAWLAKFRRLARDYERAPAVLAGLHLLALVGLLLARLLRAGGPSA